MTARDNRATPDPSSSPYEDEEPEPLYGEEEDRILGNSFLLCEQLNIYKQNKDKPILLCAATMLPERLRNMPSTTSALLSSTPVFFEEDYWLQPGKFQESCDHKQLMKTPKVRCLILKTWTIKLYIILFHNRRVIPLRRLIQHVLY